MADTIELQARFVFRNNRTVSRERLPHAKPLQTLVTVVKILIIVWIRKIKSAWSH